MITALIEDAKTRIKTYSETRALKKRVSQMKAIAGDSGYFDAINFAYTGEKFAGGWGMSRDYEVVNLYELQKRSLEMWRSNPIANVIFDRLETKIIGDGMHLEATPEINLLGFDSSSAFIQEWTETLESNYRVITAFPELVDERSRLNMVQLQRQAFNTAKLSGDALIIRRIDPATLLPRIQIIDGKHIQTPFQFSMGVNPKNGKNVLSGVEINEDGTEHGYWVRTRGFKPQANPFQNLTYKFVPAYGVNSGRRVANLLYGSRLRVDEYRGMPLLGHVLQMLKQIDRAMDYEQLAMALDATLVMSVVTDASAAAQAEAIKRLSAGPLKKASAVEAVKNVNQPDGTTKQVNFNEFMPGMFIDHLPPGMKIESHKTSRPNIDVMTMVMGSFNIINASIGIPPEIAILTFNNNFSASRQAVNEFEATKRKEQATFNAGFNDPYNRDLVLGLELTGKINTPGLMEAIRVGDNIRVAAWVMADWINRTELSVDMLKHIKMLKEAHDLGYVSHEAAAKKFFGTSWHKVIERLRKENILIAEVNKPLVDLEKTTGG